MVKQTIKSLVPGWVRRLVRPPAAPGQLVLDQLRGELHDLRSRVEWMAGFQGQLADRLESLEATVNTLRGENTELRQELEALRGEMLRLTDAFEQLRRDLGG